MTRQEIVDAVNRLAAGYNVAWADIKVDADKAIYKINSFLGTSYPLMSVILNSPFAHYALKHDGKYIPIFGDQYIVSIVIPYIASELLSRDEEFTTIYNKYLLEVEDGLFTMFSNEFNRVPHVFRQPDTTGVFFAEGTPQKPLEHHNVTPFPKFRIRYHMNNNYVLTDDRYVDTKEYNFNEPYKLLKPVTPSYYSPDGLRKYTLEGWYYDPICTIPVTISLSDDEPDGTITSDLDIYARWDSEDTLEVYRTTINDVYYNAVRLRSGNSTLVNLEIPEYINGQYITALEGELFNNYTTNTLNIDRITIPKSIKYIRDSTFSVFTGTKLEFPKDPTADITITKNGLNLNNSNIAVGTYEQCSLILTKAIKYITSSAFAEDCEELNEVPSGITREIYVKCETPWLSKPTNFSLPRNGLIKVGTVLYHIFYNGD